MFVYIKKLPVFKNTGSNFVILIDILDISQK